MFLSIAGCTPTTTPPDDSDPGQVEQPPADLPDTDLPSSPAPRTQDFYQITAQDWVDAIRVGWSLGNTLDAHAGHGSAGFSWLSDGTYENTTVAQMEGAWNGGNPATRRLFEAVKNAGFNAIRIPVTWHKAADAEMNIREDWMARVIEIVDWAVELDMYIILNTHHDEHVIKFQDKDMEESKANFTRLWEQIAYTFKDYNEKLIFQGLNEPRTIGLPNEWSGGTEEERNNINALNQIFVDVVRASGGFNSHRILALTTHAASTSETAQRGFVLPQDSTPDRILVTLHNYAPWEFALRTSETGMVDTWSKDNPSDTAPITQPLHLAVEVFQNQGIPVVIGEFGALNRDNIDARVEHAEFYTSYAAALGIPCFWWDSGITTVVQRHDWGWDQPFGITDRRLATFVFPEIVDALMRGTE